MCTGVSGTAFKEWPAHSIKSCEKSASIAFPPYSDQKVRRRKARDLYGKTTDNEHFTSSELISCQHQCVWLYSRERVPTAPRALYRPAGWILATHTHRCSAKADSIYKEGLTLVWTALFLKPRLRTSRIIIGTGDEALIWFLKSGDATADLERGWLPLLNFDFTVVDGAGI